MELRLLRSRTLVLGREGIPLALAHRLVKQGRYHDANLHAGYGTDSVLEEIQRREHALGTLSEEQIALRIAADFCCIWRYDYPQRVHDLCARIGGRPAPGLRLHYQICPDRRAELISYATALKGWLQEKPVEEYEEGTQSVARRVYQYLGSREPLKDMLVERTFIGLSLRALNCSFWGIDNFRPQTPLSPFHAAEIDANAVHRMTQLERLIMKDMGAQARDFLCDVGGTAEPACHFKFTRRIDILVSSIGCLRWRGNLPPKDTAVSGRRGLTKTYLDILEQYWNGQTYRFDADGARIRDELFESLGKPDDTKQWLVACLWKNISDQTTYHTYPMRQWVDFVHIGEQYLDQLESAGRST